MINHESPLGTVVADPVILKEELTGLLGDQNPYWIYLLQALNTS